MRKKVSSNQPPTYVTDDCYFSDAVQDVKPDSNVLSSVGDWSSHFAHKLVGVDSDLEDVVGEREKWSQWECRHKDGDETELENCEEQFNMTTLSTIIRNLKVIDKYTKQNEDCSRARPEGTPYSHNQLVIIIICFRTRPKKFRQFRKSENIANTGCL